MLLYAVMEMRKSVTGPVFAHVNHDSTLIAWIKHQRKNATHAIIIPLC